MNRLLPTKFYLPPAPIGFVARPHLFDKLNEALTCRLALVSAPAGAGKTTLVSAWAQSLHKKGAALAWLSLDEADNTPIRFMEYLIASIEEGGAQVEPTTLWFDNSSQALSESVLAEFVCGLLNLKQELILILDDYHVIHNPDIHAALGYLLEHMPARLHIVFLTRSDPPLALARLRVAGQLVEIRMDDLRFSTQEAALLLKRSAGVQLAEADVAALNARAEGWVAGLQMAAISLRGRDNASAFVAAFAGSHRFVFDYLLEEVLNQQTPQVREFLLKTSVLDRLSAPLCDAVLETEGAARLLLDTLERANLFLSPLDDERDWYRYHPLFVDLLKLVLEQTHPGLIPELHCRASHWYEVRGMIPEALEHALAAGDMELAARLVSANVLALVEHAELAPILLRVEATPPTLRAAMPWLGVAHAWALAYTGQTEKAETALSLAEKHYGWLPDDERQQMMGHIGAVRAYLAWVQGNQQAAVELAMEAAPLLPLEEFAVRALNVTTLGNALIQYENDPRAVEVLEHAVALAQQAGQSHVYLSAASALAYAYTSQGRLRNSHAVCWEAIRIVEAYQQRNGQPLPAAASVYAQLASILGEWGEIERCIQAARKGLALSELWGQADTILLCLLNLADGLSLARDFDASQEVIQRARKLAQKVSPWFVLNVNEIAFRIYLDADNIGQAARLTHDLGSALRTSLGARLLLKQNRPDEALSLAEQALPEALTNPSLATVRLGVIQSLAHYARKDETQALAVLEQTLAVAEPENRVMAFVREGALMEKLLRLAFTRRIAPEFTRRLLDACEALHQARPAPITETLIEPLSERELEILRLLNGPLSTPEIARQLIVSANTVRTHIKNIYGKLGVHGRSAAVRRAQELGLLA